MMNKRFAAIIAILTILISCSRSNEHTVIAEDPNSQNIQGDKFNFENYLRTEYEELNIQLRESGNFMNSSNNEEFVFFEDPTERYNVGDEDQISKTVFFVYNDEGIISKKEFDLWTLAYSKDELEIIKSSADSFGMEPKACMSLDYNRNGRSELYFFTLTGMHFGVFGIEYHEDSFKYILDSSKYTMFLSSFQKMDGNEGLSTLKLYGSGRADIPKDKIDWYVLKWNGEQKAYSIFEEGTE